MNTHVKAYGFKRCCRFSLPISVCIDVNFSCLRDDWQLLTRMSTNYTFATVYKGRHTKEMSVIDEPAWVHVAVRLQLLEMSSITTPNHVCTRYNILKALFYEKYWRFLPICDNEKIQYGKLLVNGIVLISGNRINVYKIS